jgi:hypothetical protein
MGCGASDRVRLHRRCDALRQQKSVVSCLLSKSHLSKSHRRGFRLDLFIDEFFKLMERCFFVRQIQQLLDRRHRSREVRWEQADQTVARVGLKVRSVYPFFTTVLDNASDFVFVAHGRTFRFRLVPNQ